MAIADTINSMKTNITNAYNAIQTKGGTIPTNKNLANLSTAINSISTGGSGGGIEEVSTVAALKAKVTLENVGKFYKYTGTSSGGFETNELYCVVENSGGGYNVLGLGKVTYNTTKYTVAYKYTACGDDAGDPIRNMPLGGTITVDVYTGVGPYADYVLPDTITVTGCQYTWVLSSTKKNGTLTLYNATGNITVTIIATAVSSYGKTPTKEGLWNLFGDNNFRGAKNSSNVFDDIGFMSDFISNYSKISGGATSYWTQFIEDLSAAGSIVKSAVENGDGGLTDKDFVNIMGSLEKAFSGVSLTVKIVSSSASEADKSGYINMKVEFGKNAYYLYMWLKPTKPYAPLD